MDDVELKRILTHRIDNALNSEEGDVSEVRQHNFNRYYGKQYGNERDGHSKFTTREVFEAVEWAMPSILRVFTSNERAVEFVARDEQDERRADEETDIVNHYVQVENNGFLILHNWTKDLLMNPNGYVKAYVKEQDVVKHTRLSGLTLDALNQIQADPNATIVEAESYTQSVEGYGSQELHSVRVRYTTKERKICIENLPPDETLIDDNWTSVSLEGCPFVCHRVRRSVSELVQQGYDAEELKALGDTEDNTWNDERVNRLFYEEESPDSDDGGSREGAGKLLWVHEISIEVDYDDDDIAERRRIVMIGNEIFENEEDSYQPIVSCAAIIMPHKHIAMSYIEAVSDLQLLATTVTRQLLDNTYAQTDKRHYFREESLLEDNSTMEDYLDARNTAIIVRGNPAEAVMPEITAPITSELLQVIEHIKKQPKLRTGVAPELSLDPAVLQQSTMGAFMGALDQASQRLDMLVRVIAEIGYKELMVKTHTLVRNFINEPSSVRIRGRWVNYDPGQWQERSLMKVNVGLGFNNKQQKIQLLTGVLGLQKEALSQNLSDPSKIYNTLERLVEASSIGNASSYFIDPKAPITNPQTGQQEPWQPPQPQPDANMILAQAQAKALSDEQMRKAQEMQVKAQNETQKMRAETEKAQALMDLERAKIDLGYQKLKIEQDKVGLSQDEFEAKYETDSSTVLAKIRETYAAIELKEAQTRKINAEATSEEIENDDTVSLANEIVNTVGGEGYESTPYDES